MASEPQVPVTVIGGYLGAGKTTLLNRLLAGDHGLRLAVLVNDFGAIDVDAELIAANDGETVSMANGCICCAIADDAMGAFAALRERAGTGSRLDHVVVEASGVSDPARVAQLARAAGFGHDGTLVLADAERIRDQAADRYVGDTVVGQLLAADLVVVSKGDLVERPAVDRVRDWLAGTIPGVRVVEAIHGELPVEVVLGARDRDAVGDDAPVVHEHRPHAGHATWTVEREAPMSRTEVEELVASWPPAVVRAKGFVVLADDQERRHLLQLVGRRWTLTPSGPWADAPRRTRLVVIATPDGHDP